MFTFYGRATSCDCVNTDCPLSEVPGSSKYHLGKKPPGRVSISHSENTWPNLVITTSCDAHWILKANIVKVAAVK